MKQASLIIIGDKILSGRTEDKNLAYLANWLGKLGIHLSEVRVVLDDESAIIEAVKNLRVKYDYVFTTGGIGPTHDDITTECVAKAFGVETRIDDDALGKMKAFFEGKELTEPLLKMLRIPYTPRAATLVTRKHISIRVERWLGTSLEPIAPLQ